MEILVTILVPIITGIFSVVGVIITNKNGNNKIQQEINVKMAVTDTKIEELTREVRTHNNFAQKIPTLTVRLDEMEKRVAKLEK